MDSTGKLIDQFVAMLNSTGLEPLFAPDVPEELRIGELAEIPDMFLWKIRAAEPNPWVSELEAILPYPFPLPYKSLIARFRFAKFDLGPIMFLANTGDEVFHELFRVLADDKEFQRQLLQHGFLQFGRQSGGGFDPVCFAMKERKNGDAPVVQLDHEDLMIRDRICIRRKIAPSFLAFAEQVIAGELKSGE